MNQSKIKNIKLYNYLKNFTPDIVDRIIDANIKINPNYDVDYEKIEKKYLKDIRSIKNFDEMPNIWGQHFEELEIEQITKLVI